MSFILSLRLDKLNFLISNLLILAGIKVSYVLAVDLEHANND
jgi:predicted permease